MKNIRKLALLAGMLGMCSQEHFMFSARKYPKNNPNYKVKFTSGVLREFTVNGKKIMAFSRKDAIKRLKHR